MESAHLSCWHLLVWPPSRCGTEQMPARGEFSSTRSARSRGGCAGNALSTTPHHANAKLLAQVHPANLLQGVIGNVTYWGILCLVKHTWNVQSLFHRQNNFFFFFSEENCYISPCGGVMAFASCFLVLDI